MSQLFSYSRLITYSVFQISTPVTWVSLIINSLVPIPWLISLSIQTFLNLRYTLKTKQNKSSFDPTYNPLFLFPFTGTLSEGIFYSLFLPNQFPLQPTIIGFLCPTSPLESLGVVILLIQNTFVLLDFSVALDRIGPFTPSKNSTLLGSVIPFSIGLP